MKPIRRIIPILLLASIVAAQTGDWHAVQRLSPGSHISVKTRFRYVCVFQMATDVALECEAPPRGFLQGSRHSYRFDRNRVREVRLEHSDDTNAAVGAAVGAGVGSVIGASSGNGALIQGGSALLFGAAGAIAGGTFSRDFPILHREVIYKR